MNAPNGDLRGCIALVSVDINAFEKDYRRLDKYLQKETPLRSQYVSFLVL